MSLRNISILLLLCSCMACETLVDDIPANKIANLRSKLVMHSFISPNDTAINVRLSLSTPLFGELPNGNLVEQINPNGDTIRYYSFENERLITDALITISDGTKKVALKYNSKTRHYYIPTTEFGIKNGVTYYLQAKSNEYEVSASTTVPSTSPKIESVKIDSLPVTIEYYQVDSTGNLRKVSKTNTGYNIQFGWQDIANNQDFYILQAKLSYEVEYPQVQNGNVIFTKGKSIETAQWGKKRYDPLSKYFTDFNQDGQFINSPIGVIGRNQIPNEVRLIFKGVAYTNRTLPGTKLIEIGLLNANSDYYKNRYSVENTFFTGNENPFTEPIQIYSNVKNGLGCFGAYTIETLTRKIQ